MHATFISDTLPFSEAADTWIATRDIDGNERTRLVKPRTLKDLRQYKRALDRFFRDIPLKEIHVGHLRSYQSHRAKGELGDPEADAAVEVGPNKINQELGMLVRVIKAAGAWGRELEDLYEPLQYEESDIARAMTPQEQERFLKVAASRPEWQVVYWYSLLALRTTATNCELRGLRLGDIDTVSAIIYIRRATSKNKYRQRTIPLIDDAAWAVSQLLARAHSLGCKEPQHYLMPFRVCKGDWDIMRSMTNSGLKKPWDEVRTAAGIPWMRIHDLRHTAITRMAEAGVPIMVIMSFSGHLTRKMIQHYTHISDSAQRQAAEAAFGKKKPMQSFPHMFTMSASS
jgi:integrase